MMTGVRRSFESPRAPFTAQLTVPGDKSLSHRALLFAGMAEGRSEVTGLGTGRDIASTAAALRALGVDIAGDAVRSPGVQRWRAVAGTIDCGNSGTSMRLLAGALSGRPFRSVLVGDESLSVRPMRRLVEPLGRLGASIAVSEHGTPPVTVGGGDLHGAEIDLGIPSAQLRTSVAMAALQAEGPTIIRSPPGYRDHTERWLGALGLATRDEDEVVITPGSIPPGRYGVPGDPSSAAYLWCAAALIPGASVTVTGVSLNPGRLGILTILDAMGADVVVVETGSILDDPIGDVTVSGADLVGIEVSGSTAVAALDELPLVAVLGTAAEGETRVADAAELRGKESDRIASSVAMVTALGGRARETADGFVVTRSSLTGGVVDASGDHRIAMTAAVASVVAAGRVAVEGFDAADISWPGFADILEDVWS